MTCADEGKSDKDKRRKSELLPRGDEAKEIVDVLAAMYRSMHNPEAAANDDRNENAN